MHRTSTNRAVAFVVNSTAQAARERWGHASCSVGIVTIPTERGPVAHDAQGPHESVGIVTIPTDLS